MLTQAATAALVAAGLAALADWTAILRCAATVERLTKPAVILLLVLAVVAEGPGDSPRRWLLIGALSASLAGDWLLLPPTRFTAGLAAFLLAHLAYLAVFLSGPLDPAWALGGGVVAAATLLGLGRPILAGATRAGMQAPVGAYLVAICAMAVAATASGSLLAAAGGWLFVASDAMLGWGRFVAPAPGSEVDAARTRVVVMSTYHLAQAALVIAILRA